MDARIDICLTCTEPPERCDDNGKGRPCPYHRQFRKKAPPPVMIQHFAGRKELPAEKYGHEAIYKAAMRLEREINRSLRAARAAM